MRKSVIRIWLAPFILFVCFPRLSPAVENFRVAYPSMSTSVFYLLIAQQRGYYKQEGLNLEILNIRGEIAIKTALAGEVDVFTNAGSALAGAVRGVPLKILSVVQDRPSWELYVAPQVKSVEQLKGSPIGVMSPEGSLAVVTRKILQKHGIDPARDAQLIVMGGDDVRFMALKGGAIKATLLNPPTGLMARRDGFESVARSADYVSFLQGGLATTDEKIRGGAG